VCVFGGECRIWIKSWEEKRRGEERRGEMTTNETNSYSNCNRTKNWNEIHTGWLLKS
jgi:hypothetical protein